MDSHPESKVHPLTSSNFFSLHWRIRIRKLHSSKLINMDHYQDLLNSWRHVTTWKSLFKIQVEIHLLSMLKVKVPIINLIIPQEIYYWNQVTRKNFGNLPLSIPYGSPSELIIYFVVMFINYSGMEQYLHTNTSKYGVRESTSSMEMLQEIILTICHITVI